MKQRLGGAAVALLILAGSLTRAAADNDTWYTAMAAGDACVSIAAMQQRIETMLGFNDIPPWRTPSDVVYAWAVGGHNIRPVIMTPNVKVFSDELGGT
jgi:hypothetical protein